MATMSQSRPKGRGLGRGLGRGQQVSGPGLEVSGPGLEINGQGLENSGRGRGFGRGVKSELSTIGVKLVSTATDDDSHELNPYEDLSELTVSLGDATASQPIVSPPQPPSSPLPSVDKVSANGSGDVSVDFTYKLAKSVERKLSLKTQLFVKRPELEGTKGRQIAVVANHFRLQLNVMSVYHYDVDIDFARNSDIDGVPAIGGAGDRKMRKMAQKENLDVIEKLAKEWPDVFARTTFVFDGLKNLYTSAPLNLDDQRITKTVKVTTDGYGDQYYRVAVKATNDFEIKMSSINDYFEKRITTLPEDALHVLEIILRYKSTGNCVPVGRSLYPSIESNQSITANTYLSYGHNQAVHMTQVGPTLVINRTATLFHKSKSLIDFMLGLTGHKDICQINFNDQRVVADLNRQLDGIRVTTAHTGGKRHAILAGLSDEPPNSATFIIKKDGVETETSVLQYFKDHYNIVLKYPTIPCFKLKGRVARLLPIEMCDISSNQPVLRKHTTSRMTSDLVRKSGQQRPIERFQFVQDTVNSVAAVSKSLFSQMGVSMSTEAIHVNGRVLDKPSIVGTDRRLFEPKTLTKWWFISIGPSFRKDHEQKVMEFLRSMKDMANKMGVQVAKPEIVKQVANPNRDKSAVEMVFKRMNPKPELVMFCIPYGDGTYHQIKHLADIEYGVMTQCVKVEHVLITPKGCLTNLWLKINGKLNGQNTIVRNPQPPAYMTGLMVIGADVTHPAPADRMMSSVAAVIGSYDSELTKYAAAIRVQRRDKQEIISEFKEMLIELLKQYLESNNNNRPSSLILFRDGVSQGQFDQVLKDEYKQMRAACAHLDPQYEPKITFVVVQKRHHTRFMPQNPNELGVGRAGNIPAGTVVDNTIVDPVLFEYYLCSHSGNIGTSRPAKYIVLHDDHNLSFDEMERLSYQLCYTFVRSTASISVPIPVMYAHLAAKRAKEHIIAHNRDPNFHYTNERREDMERRVANDLNDKIKVSDVLRNQFYYC